MGSMDRLTLEGIITIFKTGQPDDKALAGEIIQNMNDDELIQLAQACRAEGWTDYSMGDYALFYVSQTVIPSKHIDAKIMLHVLFDRRLPQSVIDYSDRKGWNKLYDRMNRREVIFS